MPWIVAVCIGLLGRMLENLIGRIVIALGVGVVTATGVDLALAALKAQTLALFTGFDPRWVQLMGLAKVDVAVSMLLGAVISAFAVRMVAGSLSRFVARQPT